MFDAKADNDLRFGCLGYDTVTREILNGIDIDPDLIISFTESVEGEYRRRVTYEYDKAIWVETINSQRATEAIEDRNTDVLLVMGWPELFKPELIDALEIECMGRHLSLKRRGHSPAAWVLTHALSETGVSLFWIDENVDSGELIDQRVVQIDPSEHAADLHHNCTQATIALLNQATLLRFRDADFSSEPKEGEATYSHPRRPDMGIIDLTDCAWGIQNFVRRQSHPYPGAFT
ncbi:hypothetical protein DVK05_04675 [Halorubrum sp. Atlit-8R]|uniref:formyltransferase family protein n=1 Tax=unclassified Halorubrum TaxID=2642239 RepID=UPI000EF1C680|nr:MULTISPECIES: formyltransferase family protein [unclassified Halorubrum]RLM70760.1 hypothetical protein DVK08_01085 [Halorubrum sp. Atlit-9R]RLM71628.1 hypothetical protein DVK08_05825 [Halorubrum sp. Atlit-9R]RLM83087.1 hypothetical protein DVK05_04675 [Halorubrum sp. Atlit-8R]